MAVGTIVIFVLFLLAICLWVLNQPPGSRDHDFFDDHY